MVGATAGAVDSDWFARSWQTEDGLPNNNVTSLAQTPDGFLWVATPRGLARFDGIHFDEISLTNFIGDANRGVRALLADRAGGLWLEMDRGAVVNLNAHRIAVAGPTNGLVDLTAQKLVEGDDGTLWISYLGGAICSLKDGKGTVISAEQDLPFAEISSVAKDTKGRVWLSRAGRVGIFRNGHFQSLAEVNGTATRLGPAGRGGVWICSGSTLYHLDEGTILKEMGTIDGPRVAPATVFEDSRGAVWVGTAYDGLYHFDGSQFKKIPLPHKEISCVLEDGEGNIWVGTRGGGLNRLRPSAITLENVEKDLPPEDVRSVAEDPAGTIWAVTENGLLVRRDAEGWSTVSTDANRPGAVTCVTAGPDGAIWVGTRNRKLIRWQNGQLQSWEGPQGIETAPVSVVMVSRDGDLWVGGNNRTLEFFHDGRFNSVALPEDARAVRAIVQDVGGDIWVGTSQGLLLRVRGTNAVDETPVRGSPISIRCLYTTPDGSLWIGYAGGGLGRFKAGRLTRITTEQGLFDDYISQIVTDAHGAFWFGADRGIFKVSGQELMAAAENPAMRVHSVHYGRGEGLPSLQAEFGYVSGAIRSRDGRIWMPTRSALVVVDPEKLVENPRPPPVLVKRVVVDGREIAEYGGVVPVPAVPGAGKRRVQIAPDHRKLEFDFTALSFSAPENLRIQYRLEGFDNEWLEADAQRSASYSRLPAGDYWFHVRACNNDGIWNDAGATFGFTVTPFVWQRWWFQPLGWLLFAVLMVIAVRYVSFRRLRSRLHLLEQQAALDKERGRIARDLHDDLGSHLTRIVLLSDLMVDYRAEPEKSGETAQRVSATARQVIKSLDETVWAINPRHDTLSHLINYIGPFAVEFLRMAAIRCHADLPLRVPETKVSTEVRHNLFLVVKEALNNVVSHAGAGEVRLKISVDDRLIHLVIEDDGRGFDRTPADNGADGLRNMRQRVEEIGGEFRLESKPAAGTRITVSAPLVRRE